MDPQHLGPYDIRSRLGRGGMGSVYEAVDTTSGALVALKTLTVPVADDAPIRQRFLAEIETLKSLRHPAIVQMLAFGEHDGQPYFAMELVRGRSLEQELRAKRSFAPRETVDLAREVAGALKGAHDHGIIHRDLKPANLLLPAEPVGGVHVKLTDFGIARLFGAAGATQHGSVVGTIEYMAPEQCVGGAIDHRADLYALGLVLFAMLTGQPPFRGPTHAEVLERQRSERPPRLASLVPGMPRDLDELVARLLAKAPAERPASALAVMRLLETLDLERTGVAPAVAVPRLGARTAAVGPGSMLETARPGEGTRPAEPPLPRTAAPATVGPPGGGPNADDTEEHVRPASPVPLRPAEAGPTGELLGDTTAYPLGRALPPVNVVATGRVATAAAGADTQAGSLAAGRGQPPTVPDVGGEPGPRRRPDVHMTVAQLDRQKAEIERQAVNRQWWIRASGTLLATVGLGVGGWLLLRPPTADHLHERIVALAAAPDGDLRDARPLIDAFLANHAADPRAAEISALGRRLRVDALERRTRRRLSGGRTVAPIERDYRAALARETESPTAAIAMLEAILAVHELPAEADADAETWRALVDRQVVRLTPLAAQEQAEDLARIRAALAEAAGLAAQADAAAAAAARTTLADRRRALLASVVEIYGDRPHAAAAVTEAKRLLAESPPVPESP